MNLFDISAVEIGQHFYWTLFGAQVHGQVLINTWLVIGLILLFAFTTGQGELQMIPEGGQNLGEAFVDYIRGIAQTQIGKDYKEWVPFVGTLFLFIFVSNWSGALIPWKFIELPNGELGAPTNDINTTVALSLLVSVAYFYAGLKKKGFGYFTKYVEPTPILFPINVLEDFTKTSFFKFPSFWEYSCR
jgi:F-type H+-transporting ATPase subunit a